MSRKTVAIKMPAKAEPVAPAADAWVSKPTADVRESGQGATVTRLAPAQAPAEATKRFTIDVSEALHKRIKAQCAMRGSKMADVLRELLEREFPEQ
jgi:hypothetical protein